MEIDENQCISRSGVVLKEKTRHRDLGSDPMVSPFRPHFTSFVLLPDSSPHPITHAHGDSESGKTTVSLRPHPSAAYCSVWKIM
jgi:hypothetical protein